jgi:Ca2+-binding RTX toxin-like protein
VVNVTVPGVSGATTTLVYDSAANAATAAQFSAMIAAAIKGGTEVAGGSGFGPPPPLRGQAGLFVQNLSGVTTLPHGYADVSDPAANAVIFGSGDPNEHILAGAGNLTFYATGGSGAVVTGAGNNLISIPVTDAGNWLIETGGGNDTIIARGTGVDTIGAGGGANAISLGGGQYNVASTGQDTITAGSGAATIDASGSSVGGSQLVFGGSGSLVFVGGAGAATVTAGTGSATLFGGSGSDVFSAQGSAGQLLSAGAGNATLNGAGATGADTFAGGSGQDLITGSQGADTYVGGAGQATVNAIGSANLFRFVDGHSGGSMQVNDLTDASQVLISLSGYGPNEAANAVAGQTSTANSVSVTLSDNTTITFENITHLSSGNFS